MNCHDENSNLTAVVEWSVDVNWLKKLMLD
jgi:hypothetical protein